MEAILKLLMELFELRLFIIVFVKFKAVPEIIKKSLLSIESKIYFLSIASSFSSQIWGYIIFHATLSLVKEELSRILWGSHFTLERAATFYLLKEFILGILNLSSYFICFSCNSWLYSKLLIFNVFLRNHFSINRLVLLSLLFVAR